MRLQNFSQVSLKSIGPFQYFKFIFHISYKVTIVVVWPRTSPKFWLVVCKRNLHIDINLLFYVPLPWALISGRQPHDRATEASLSATSFLSLSVSTHHPHPDGDPGANSNLSVCFWTLVFPCKFPVEFQRQSSFGQSREVKPRVAISSLLLSSLIHGFSRQENECLLNAP